ncbi:MAG: hypothetical protein H8E66_06860 [Planctomycetes bacterium]|nr:hypothetical protein [Planctomycetota bacterium]
MRSIKSECLENRIFFGENSWRNVVREYLAHYHRERNHQGLESKIIDSGEEIEQIAGKVECRERLGGLCRRRLNRQRLTDSVASKPHYP